MLPSRLVYRQQQRLLLLGLRCSLGLSQYPPNPTPHFSQWWHGQYELTRSRVGVWVQIPATITMDRVGNFSISGKPRLSAVLGPLRGRFGHRHSGPSANGGSNGSRGLFLLGSGLTLLHQTCTQGSEPVPLRIPLVGTPGGTCRQLHLNANPVRTPHGAPGTGDSSPQPAAESERRARDDIEGRQGGSGYADRQQTGWATSLPTKKDLLDGLHGFFPRLKVHIRWLLKGASISRPWTIDDVFALASWIIMSHAMMLLIATTTFVSIIVWLLNNLRFQQWVSKKLSQWASRIMGVTVEFDSQVAPIWRSGTLSFNNVRFHCGPEHGLPIATKPTTQFEPSEDSPSAILTSASHEPRPAKPETNTNFTYYDIKVSQLQVTLSLWRWMDGKGLVKDLKVRGVRGVVDRRHVWWDPDIPYDPARERERHRPGTFEFESVQVEDCLVTLYNTNNFRPINISIYSASFPKLRQQWFMYDMLSADSIVGMYDKSLFSFHRAHQAGDAGEAEGETHTKTQIQVDNLKIDHLNAGDAGPMGWISSGNVNISALISLPKKPTENTTEALKQLVTHLADSVDVVILPSKPDWADPESSNNPVIRILRGADLLDTPFSQLLRKMMLRQVDKETQRRLEQHKASSSMRNDKTANTNPSALTIDLSVSLNDIRASVPLTTPHLSYLSSALLIRPIVGYMNSHRTSIPVHCFLRMDIDDFNGAWNLYDSGISHLVSEGMGEAFVRLVRDEQERNRRLRLIGWWSISTLAKELVYALEYVTGKRSLWHNYPGGVRPVGFPTTAATLA